MQGCHVKDNYAGIEGEEFSLGCRLVEGDDFKLGIALESRLNPSEHQRISVE